MGSFFCAKARVAGHLKSIAKQSLFHTVLIFHMPRHIKDILNDTMVGKRYTGLKLGVHAGAIHAVKKRLHEPFDIEISDYAAAFVLTGLAVKERCF